MPERADIFKTMKLTKGFKGILPRILEKYEHFYFGQGGGSFKSIYGKNAYTILEMVENSFPSVLFFFRRGIFAAPGGKRKSRTWFLFPFFGML